MTITLDTNVLMEYWKKEHKAFIVDSLLNFADSGRLDLAISNRVEEDIFDPPLNERIRDLPVLNIKRIGSAFRFGYSRFGSGDMFSSDIRKEMESVEDISYPMFPPPAPSRHANWQSQSRKKKRPDWRDVDHLYAHYCDDRDRFVTWDKGILNVAKELSSMWGIITATPEALLLELESRSQ